jgi:hypothetical protein
MEWDYMSWEAAATLLTGLAAVLAAYSVGRRQGDISAGLLSIERLKVRTELFERRFAVYEQVRKWLSYILMSRYPPNERSVLGGKIAKGFNDALDISRFLLQPSVHAELEKLRLLAIDLDYHLAGIDNPVTVDPEGEVAVSEENHSQSVHQIMGEFYKYSET